MTPMVIVAPEHRDVAIARLRSVFDQIEEAIRAGRPVAYGLDVPLVHDVTRPGDTTIALKPAAERQLSVRFEVAA